MFSITIKEIQNLVLEKKTEVVYHALITVEYIQDDYQNIAKHYFNLFQMAP